MKKANDSSKKMPKGFEKSKFDNDKGVTEGGKADMKKDKTQIAKFIKAKAKKGGKK